MAFFTVGFDSFISAYQREGNESPYILYMEIQCAVSCMPIMLGGGGGTRELMRIPRENGQRLILKNYLYHSLGSRVALKKKGI